MAKEIQNNGNIISVPGVVELPYQKGIGQLFFDKMSEYKESFAQIDGVTGQKDSYGYMLVRSIRTAITMRSRGVTSEDIITVCSTNHLNTNIPIIASLFLGAKTACTDPSLSLTDTVFLLKQVRPKMIFVSPNGTKLIEDALEQIGIDAQIVVFGDTSKHSNFSEFLDESPEEKNFTPVKVVDLKETASIFFSSGTSGMPKGICLSHLMLLAQLPRAEDSEAYDGMVSLTFSSPYWVSSFLFLQSSVVSRGCRIIVPNFDPGNIWTLIEKYQVFLTFLSPSHIATICSHGRPEGVDTSSLKVIPVGGSPNYKEQLEEVRKLFPGTLVCSGYGQTELGGAGIGYRITTNPEEIRFIFEKPTAVGRPLPGYLFKIVDPETEEILGVNQKGEMRIKTEFQMNGYYNLDSSNAWDSDGFLKTGDIAYYDEDYCIFIVDRIKELLKFQNWQIAPAKLEAILLAHPAVESAVVIGLPDKADGDHPMGVVVLNKSGIKVTPEELEKYVEERVDDRQRLRGGVKIVQRLPTTPSGKFQRRNVKDLILAGKL